MNIIRFTIPALILAATSTGLNASAQESSEKDLQKAIVIEKEFVPVETKATKPDVLPTEAPIAAQQVNLSFSDWAVPSNVDPLLVRQSPMHYTDPNLLPLRKRGYLHFGAGSYLNMVGSAGYRIVDNSDTQIGIWLQHNSTNGSIDGITGSHLYKQFAADEKLGIGFSRNLSRGTLAANAEYRFGKFNYYGIVEEEPFGNKKQSINDFHIGLDWESDPEQTTRHYAGAEFGYFGFGYGLPFFSADMNTDAETEGIMLGKGLKEYRAKVKGGVELVFGDKSYIGFDGAFGFYNYDYAQNTVGDATYNASLITRPESYSFGMLSLTPYYSKRTGNTNLRIGARVDITFNNGTVFRIAPNVRFDLRFSNKASLFITATGGNTVNTFHALTTGNRYANPSLRLPISYTLVDARAGLNLGLWQGFSLTPYVGFAVTKNNLLPYLDSTMAYQLSANPETSSTLLFNGDYTAYTGYHGLDMNGVIAGIKFTYKYKDFVELGADYAFTPQSVGNGYVRSDDTPEHSLDASLCISPIKQLDIRLSYNLRALRSVRYKSFLQSGAIPDATNPNWRDTFEQAAALENVSNLNLGATYRINDMIGVFVEGNNLLNRRYMDYFGLYAQKFNIIGGLSLIF